MDLRLYPGKRQLKNPLENFNPAAAIKTTPFVVYSPQIVFPKRIVLQTRQK
jgi:hypothetical protein